MSNPDLKDILFENHPLPMFLFDETSLQILDVNKAAVEQYEYTREEFRELTIRDLRTPEQIPEMEQFFQNTRSFTGNIGIWEHRAKSGRTFYVEIHAQSFDKDGQKLRLAQTHEVSEISRQEVKRFSAQSEIRQHLENTSLGVIRWNRDARLQYISGKLAELFEYPPAELLGTHIHDLTRKVACKHYIQPTIQSVDRLMAGEVSHISFDIRVRSKTGKELSLRIFNSALHESDGKLVSILSIVENLTEIEETRQQLQYESNQLLLFVENSTDLITRLAIDGTYLYASPSAKKLTGYSPESLIGRNVFEFIHPESRQAVETEIRRVVESGESSSVEFRFLCGDGSWRWFEAVGRAVPAAESDEELEIHASTRDIHERKRLEDDLRAEKQFVQTALESLPGLFYMIDENQRYILWNRNLLETLEITADELLQSHPLEFYREEEREIIAEKIGQALESGTAEVEADLVSKKGKVRRHHITGRLFENRGKKYIIGSALDISDRIKQEEDLARSLKEKQVLLKEIHHRVKNNLAVISGLLELQIGSTQHPDVERALGNSQSRIKSMALIHDKLYQSRELSRIRLDEIAHELLTLGNHAMNPEWKINTEIRDTPVELNINQALPTTLIINELISNSYEHAFENHVTGTIRLTIAQQNKLISVTVEDDGSGFPEDVLGGGGNLGFTIIRTLVAQLNADLELSNNNGSRVRFSFLNENRAGSASSIVTE